MNFDPYKTKIMLKSLTIYRGILTDRVMQAFCSVIDALANEDIGFEKFINDYSALYYECAVYGTDVSLKDYLVEKIIYDNNPFSGGSEGLGYSGINKGLRRAVQNDLMSLHEACGISLNDIKTHALKKFGQTEFATDLITNLPEWVDISGHDMPSLKNNLLGLMSQQNFDSRECAQLLADFYQQNGSGEFAKYKGFVWERCGNKNGASGYLKGIQSVDPIRFSDLIAYEQERERVVNNTLQFLKGYPANNILLYGDRGTGKSSTVKALLNEYHHLGLRVIELPKIFLSDLNYVLRKIEGRGQKFIIFVDDLSFGENEEEYTALKAVLEGSLEGKPQNVVIYATSNRRHLVKEKFSDRAGLMSGNHDEEVHAGDTMQEKLSLADRFGITVTFSLPDKERYLKIVDGLARSRDLNMDKKTLHSEALKWEMRYNGRSPRTARQFIDWLAGQVTG